MDKKVKVGNNVIHPDKVRNVSGILCHFCLQNCSNGYRAFPVVLGIGTREAHYKGISIKREMHNLIEYFKIKNQPLENIIGVDLDQEVCEEWSDTGITIFNGSWFDNSLLTSVRRKIQELAYLQNKSARVVVYANTFGNSRDVSSYDNMIKTLKPHRFLGLHVMRKRDINKSILCPKGYSNYDLGFMQRSKKHKIKGLITYAGIGLHVINRNRRISCGTQKTITIV